LLDFEDFLRHRRLEQWAPDSPEARAVRVVPQRFRRDPSDPSDPTDLTDLTDQERWTLYAPWLEHDDPAVRANAIICLIHQANYLLDQQITALERQFIQEGGYSERLAAARLAFRSRKDPSDPTDPSDPSNHIPHCPRCGRPMVLRTARSGKNAGRPFWGCSGYPDCQGVVEL
jgi:four helix bundle suffix protein